jgi:hypothetical protein
LRALAYGPMWAAYRVSPARSSVARAGRGCPDYRQS